MVLALGVSSNVTMWGLLIYEALNWRRYRFGKACLEIPSATPPALAKCRGQACEYRVPALGLINFLGHPTVWSTCHVPAPVTEDAACLLGLYVGGLGQSSGGIWIASCELGAK